MINRAIISGGGTGGHIFPAIAIADEIKRRNPNAEILFVGAEGKMEMERVPAAGYKIVGLPIAGLQRKLTLANLALPFKIVSSVLKARKIVKTFKPEVAIGVGGYASGPTLKAAGMMGVPTILQEQNGFAGKTNQLLAKKAAKICVAYEGLERFFPKEKIVITGNPVRFEMVKIEGKREEAFKHYKLDSSKKTILVIGGSLGARTLNQAMLASLEQIQSTDVQVLWQCGKLYNEQLNQELANRELKGIERVQFIDRMDLAYAMADVIISRAGAISVSELCLIGKPAILVPSPNVAEDHQTHNAMALVKHEAAILVKDAEAKEQLLSRALDLLMNEDRMATLSTHIKSLGKPEATRHIVDIIEQVK